ncbi:hypothetical protein ACJRAN_002664 [Staphylococcus aureus]
MTKNTYNESMYQDYIGQQVIFYLFTEKRIIATIKEERRFELLIERIVKYKNLVKSSKRRPFYRKAQ